MINKFIRNFSYDYFNKNVTPFMNKLRNESAYADYMMNIFITKTFPNHHTMATGLYAETHGVTDNEAYDPDDGNVIPYSYELFHYNKNLLPIWTINEKAAKGRHSGTMMWPGSAFEYQNTTPKYAQVFNETIPFENRVDTLLSWFKHPNTPINFGVLYIEEPDATGHAIGINGPVFNNVLEKLDNLTRYIHRKLDEYHLNDVNVIHLSDHGMANVAMDRIINLTNYVNYSDFKMAGTASGMQIFPNPGKYDSVYRGLLQAVHDIPHFRVYKKEEIPKKYHYGNNTRIGPLFVIADVGYAFEKLYNAIPFYEDKFNFIATNASEFGMHGYDNEDEEMHPMFFAMGPAFVPRCKLEPFDNVDLVPLFCEILELNCPRNNGTLGKLTKCLTKYANNKDGASSSVVMITGIGILITITAIAGLVSMILIRRRQKNVKAKYRRIPKDSDLERFFDGIQDHENV
ncbi:bis(5'-adenosyl)-triphosphatase enpp4 isoform X2 [Cephus cinctus]|uniref:Bis(5'-adenosyl)-triphosphatase enpp4 isoform X2 n=1 Tax=Cephus cinctus TaxID=211228 RepID=A0AAJ7RDE9_CEPCN|nr:bis(5'-adenosyl)-triphosphatase enpp4 isoform X2 [Cephus cinctus]